MTVIAKRNVDVLLSPQGVSQAIDELKAVKRTFEGRAWEFRHKFAVRVMREADTMYHKAWYNDWVGGERGAGLVPTQVVETEEASIVVASGAAIFIEFGAGVYHNGDVGTSLHPLGRQLGFTIGSYPSKHPPSQGAKPFWEVDGRLTRGTEAQMVLYYALRYSLPYVEEIASEVFGK